MKLIFLLFQNSGQLVFWATVTAMLAGASSAGLIWSINFAIQNFEQLPSWLPGVFAGLCLALMVAYTLSQLVLTVLAQDVIASLRLKLIRRILACPLQHLEQVGAPSLLATLTEDVEAIATASVNITILLTSLALVIGCLVYLCWLSPLIFLLIMGFLLGSIYCLQFVMNWGSRLFRIARDFQDRLFGHFQTVTLGTKELKLHYQRRQVFLAEDLEGTINQVRQAWIRGMAVFAFAGGLGFALVFLPVGVLLFVVPQFVALTTPVLISYALTILFLITPLDGVLRALPTLNRAQVSLAKVESLGLSWAAQTRETDGWHQSSPATWKQSTWKQWQLSNVCHTYPTDQADHGFTLGPLNLEFQPGTITFIIGGNGSGKSTLVKLLTGLYLPDQGEISVDGQVIDDRNREQYRQWFSVVFADFYLFDRFLGLEEAAVAKAPQYLQQLELDHKVKLDQERLSSLNLSQGQRKRLALLTAYLEDRPIYVFDEWASDQDPVFKTVFYKSLLPALKQNGKTVIVVSHDDRYFEECDRLIKLDYGQVISDQRMG